VVTAVLLWIAGSLLLSCALGWRTTQIHATSHRRYSDDTRPAVTVRFASHHHSFRAHRLADREIWTTIRFVRS